MAKVKLEVWGFRCERCRHEWVPKSAKSPRVCPKCKSPYWDKPKSKQGNEIDEHAGGRFTTGGGKKPAE